MSSRLIMSACTVGFSIIVSACDPSDTSGPGPAAVPPTPIEPLPVEMESRGFLWTLGDGFHEIPAPAGAQGMWVTDINDRGEVAGYVTVEAGTEEYRAFKWSVEDGYAPLGSLIGPNGISLAMAVNDSGVVVGLSAGPSTIPYGPFGVVLADAFVWTGEHGMKPLDPITGITSVGRVNAAGTVILSNADGTFLWNATTGVRSLPLPPGNNCWTAVDLNDSGQVLGYAGSSIGGAWCDPDVALIWDVDGTPIPIGSRHSNSGGITVSAINNRGEVTGTIGSAGFRWSQGSGLVQLPSLDASGDDINDKGDIVGMARDAFTRRSWPFVWMASGEIVEIQVPIGFSAAGRFSINDRDQVVGNFHKGTSTQ